MNARERAEKRREIAARFALERKAERDWIGRHLYRGDDGLTATFAYGRGDLRTLNAQNRKHAFALARARWGDGWIGEPTFSTPATIYRDLVGITAMEWGRDLTMRELTPEEARIRRRYREGR